MNTPGKVVLLGSGETSPVGGKIFDSLVQGLGPGAPVISLLETPAGFELNSRKVAERVGTFLETRLQNYRPRVHIVPARKKGTEFSPDNAAVLEPLLESDLIYMGAGSPTYAIRQLQGSLAWQYVLAKHNAGAAVVLASAAIIAAGRHAVPVYEIFKVGQDPFWAGGLDFLAAYGLPLSFVPHWNNAEGGADLDTSRCFLGRERFEPLLAQLGDDELVVGVDEMTALTIDFAASTCEVSGQGNLHLIRRSGEEELPAGTVFPLARLGNYHLPVGGLAGISPETWDSIEAALQTRRQPAVREIPEEVLRLVDDRQAAREARDWRRADEIRKEIERAGWQVNDTPAGPLLETVQPDY